MVAARRVVRGEGETKQRILHAAAKHFARASYDSVQLRTIAEEVGVDVSYVHRSYGSKENLFREAIQLSRALSGAVPDGSREEVIHKIAAKVLAKPLSTEKGDVDSLLLLLRSATIPTTSALIESEIEEAWIQKLTSLTDDGSEFRGAMALSLLMGMSLLRRALVVPAARNVAKKDAERFLEEALLTLLTSTHHAPAKPSSTVARRTSSSGKGRVSASARKSSAGAV